VSARLQVRAGDAVTAAAVDSNGEVTIDGAAYSVAEISPGLYRVDNGNHRWTVAVAGPADDRWLSVDGRVARVEVAAEGERGRKRRAAGAEAFATPMPATVVKVLVEPGTAVKEGDTLIVLEAMKMELAVRAPRAGVVRQLRCVVGELVQPGVALLDFE
jgi:biotin carboxyl carrier protein